MVMKNAISQIKSTKVNANIYIVDHDPGYTSSLKKAIEKPSKYNIAIFTTGEKFIAHLTSLKFKRNDIHIVFLGYHFTDERKHTLMNGIEILEATKVVIPDIEVVMLYSSDESSYGAYARNSGAYDFVPKTDTIFLRINNIIMRIISEKKLVRTKQGFMFSTRIFLIYFLILLFAIVLYHFLS